MSGDVPVFSGVLLVGTFSAAVFAVVLLLRGLVVGVCRLERARKFFRKLTLLAFTGGLSLVLLEAGLGVWEQLAKPDKLAAAMPPELAKRDANLPGVYGARYWQGHLHVYNRDHMRWPGAIPDRTPGVCRITTVGDSMTYGYGVNATNAWPAVLEKLLQREGFKVEVLNLGVPGAQSEYIRSVVGEFVPRLKPDLVIYGICLNDFLEEGRRMVKNSMEAQIPLPKEWKDFIFTRSRTGRLFCSGYNGVLLAMGVRKDFYSDILSDIKRRRKRLGKDLFAMNEFVMATNLPPIVTMVLDQFPKTGSRGYQLAQMAEEAATKAGMDVVPTADYYAKYSGRRMEVNQWEYHPNDEAYRIFADMIAKHIVTNSALVPFRAER